MAYSTGNEERDRWLRRAISECIAAHDPLTFENVVEALPKDFDADQDEVVGMIEAMAEDRAIASTGRDRTAELVPEPKPLKNFDAPRAPQPQPPHKAAVASPPRPVMTRREANVAVQEGNNRINNARVAYREAQETTKRFRGKLAEAITQWQLGRRILTREEMVREHLRASTAHRAAMKAAGLPPTRMHTRKHPAQGLNDRGEMVNGYKGSTRGAYPGSFQHRNVLQPGMHQGVMAKKI